VTVNTTGHCERTGKISYASRNAATASRGNQRNKGRRMRAYMCPACHCWHLSTSIGYEP
jgi:hypothetical protein